MTPMQELTQEHHAIKLMLRILERVCRRIESRQKVAAEDLEQMVEFIRVFADRCHHAKEEELLFTALQRAGLQRESGPIAVMLHEHEEGRNYVQDLAAAVHRYNAGDAQAGEAIVASARGYIALLSAHIDKEDNVLYPLAERMLSSREQEQLSKDFADVERRRIGPGKHEEFHRLLEAWKRRYLEDA